MELTVQNLAEHWAKITIEEEEEGGLEYGQDDAVSAAIFDHDLCLIGRFLTNRTINFGSMRQVLASVWHPVKGVDIKEGPTEAKTSLYIFQFFHELDLKRVIENGPWTFDNHLLLCRRKRQGEQITKAEIHETSFWVQIHDLPIGFMSMKVCQDIGNFIGIFLDSDPHNFDGGWRSFMRIRVSLDTRKPLKRRMKLKRPGGEWSWVVFCYEKLPTFCFYCGILGHSDKFCEKLYARPGVGTDRAYKAYLRA